MRPAGLGLSSRTWWLGPRRLPNCSYVSIRADRFNCSFLSSTYCYVIIESCMYNARHLCQTQQGSASDWIAVIILRYLKMSSPAVGLLGISDL